MNSFARRLQQIEALQQQRDIDAVCHEAREGERRFASIPGYADLQQELHALARSYDAVPPESWRSDYTAKVVVAAFEEMRRAEGMPEMDAERVDEWLVHLYRFVVAQESSRGRELVRRLDALVEEHAMGENITDDR